MCSPDNDADADALNAWLETASPLNAAEKGALIMNAALWGQMLTPSVWQEDHILAAHGLVMIDGARVLPTSKLRLSVDGTFANIMEFAANAR